MSGPSLYVPATIAKEARQLINQGSGDAIRQGVEILLKNDLKENGAGSVDAGSDLQRGLTMLANSPFDALGVDIGAQTIDIRKAYKKMALKYHPDKNPNTTPLFQAIQCASEKLSDKGTRLREANKYKPQKPTVPSPRNKKTSQNDQTSHENQHQNHRHAPSYPASDDHHDSYQHHSRHQQSDEERKRAHQAKQEAWRKKCAQERAENERRKKEMEEEVFRKYEKESHANKPHQGYANFDNWEAPDERKPKSHPQKNANSRAYNFEDAQHEARQREEERKAREYAAQESRNHHNKKSDKEFRRESMDREAAAAKARMEARKGKGSSSSSSSSSASTSSKATEDDHVSSYAQRKQREHSDKMKEKLQQEQQQQQQPPKQKPKKYAIPKPSGLRCKVVEETSALLEWSKVTYSLATLCVELGYRCKALLPSGAAPDLADAEWEVASTLITAGDKVKKKNLKTFHCYEFRIRYMVPNQSGNKTTDCGEWSNIVRSIISKTKEPLRQKNNSQRKEESYSKYYNPEDYYNNGSHDKEMQRKDKTSNKNKSEHHHAPDPYNFEDYDEDQFEEEEEEGEGDSFAREKDIRSRYKDAHLGLSHRDKPAAGGKEKQKNFKDSEIEEEVEEDPEMANIFSQSARMAWKWEGAKGKAGVPETQEEYYARHFSRNSPPPEEVDEEGSQQQQKRRQAGGQKQGGDEDVYEESYQQPSAGSGHVWYLLSPPPGHSKGFYIHTVYEHNDREHKSNPKLTEATRLKLLSVLGFISSENYVLINLDQSKALSSGAGSVEDEWLCCQVHWKKRSPTDRTKLPRNQPTNEDDDLPWGWVKKFHSTRADNHQFLVPASGLSEDQSYDEHVAEEVADDEEESSYGAFNSDYASYGSYNHHPHNSNVDVWYEQTDDQGNIYYYNNKTGESQWEAPEWVEEMDPASGARYFVKLNKSDASPLNSTWSNPGKFARLVRQSSVS